MPEQTLEEKFKQHIHFEEGMDETMLPVYIESAKKYVQNATGTQTEYLVLIVAGIMYEYRVAEKELTEALNAITLFIIQEAFYGQTDE